MFYHTSLMKQRVSQRTSEINFKRILLYSISLSIVILYTYKN